MKTIGLIGGMSWESSTTYYQLINREVKDKLGGLHSAKCVLYSIDFHEIEGYQSSGQWEKAGELLSKAAIALEKAGADFVVLCTNTMHKCAAQIQAAIRIPFLHIAEATTEAIVNCGLNKIALLGTAYTMEENFYTSTLETAGLEVLIPEKPERDRINEIIFKELCLGNMKESSKAYLQNIIADLVGRGAEGIILGCTEIGLLINEHDTSVPLFDTTIIHAQKATKMALS